jgi:hypothetical protein
MKDGTQRFGFAALWRKRGRGVSLQSKGSNQRLKFPFPNEFLQRNVRARLTFIRGNPRPQKFSLTSPRRNC